MTTNEPTATAKGISPWSERIGTRTFALAAFFSLLHLQLALALMPTWADGTYYDYGFLVPLLLPYLFLQRWGESGLNPSELENAAGRLGRNVPVIVMVVATLVAITLLRMTQWADSGWRTPLYLHAFVVLGLSVVMLAMLLGKRIVAFTGCALLVVLAVPLPTNFEKSLIHGLTVGVLETSLFVNRMLGLPLMSSGETIYANGIPLQVSDGCSGIRSFQSGIFAGFVLGEFLRLPIVSRVMLLASGLGFAFLMNCARVIYLVRHAVSHPDADLQKIHDISGYVSLTATFLLIAGLAALLLKLERRSAPVRETRIPD